MPKSAQRLKKPSGAYFQGLSLSLATNWKGSQQCTDSSHSVLTMRWPALTAAVWCVTKGVQELCWFHSFSRHTAHG